MQQGTYIAQEELETVQVCALLDGQIARSVPVSFATFDGTAEGTVFLLNNASLSISVWSTFLSFPAQNDYSPLNDTISFQPATSAVPLCISINVINDLILENDEMFTVRLSSADTDVILESQNAIVSISDDDGR